MLQWRPREPERWRAPRTFICCSKVESQVEVRVFVTKATGATTESAGSRPGAGFTRTRAAGKMRAVFTAVAKTWLNTFRFQNDILPWVLILSIYIDLVLSASLTNLFALLLCSIRVVLSTNAFSRQLFPTTFAIVLCFPGSRTGACNAGQILFFPRRPPHCSIEEAYIPSHCTALGEWELRHEFVPATQWYHIPFT